MKKIIKKVLIVVMTIGTMLANVGVYAVTGNEITDESISDASVFQVGYKGNAKTSLEMKILPSINSTVIATIEENTEYNVLDIMNKWCYIETPSFTGWVLRSKLNGEETSTPVTSTPSNNTSTENTVDTNTTVETPVSTVKKFVSTDTLNVREEADTESSIISQVSINDEVTVLEEVNSTWSKIQFKDVTGYVASKYLSDSKTTITSRSISSSRKKTTTSKVTENVANTNTYTEVAPVSGSTSSVVSYAKQFLGCRYVSGGSSPSGFDCSGFTSYVYRQFGVNLSRTTSGQNTNGTYVDRSNLQAGDIVVFRNRSNTSVGHVGIYIGGNSFIHAENSKTGVCIGSLSSSYYSTRYVGARRVMN